MYLRNDKQKIPHCREQFQNPTEKEIKIDSPNKQIHDRSLSWLGTGTSIQSGGYS